MKPNSAPPLYPIKKVHNRRRRHFRVQAVLVLVILWLVAVMLYQTQKPLPAGVSFEGKVHHVQDVDFLWDLSYKQPDGAQAYDQKIFDHIYQAIGSAQKFVVVDMFLFNGYYDKSKSFPPLSETLAQKLIDRKKQVPGLQIIVLSDEVNTSYGSHPARELEKLKAEGIPCLITPTEQLRDSTPFYSAVWRTFLQWFGQSGKGWVPNPMANTAPPMTLRSYLELFNVKANHRKAVITENTAIVISANAHDASFYNSNIGFEVKGGALIEDSLTAEQAVSNLAGGPKLPEYRSDGKESGDIGVQLLTEGKIYHHLLDTIKASKAGDTIWMGMFYLADRAVIRELLQAAERGVKVNLILDPNQNAFGQDKIGIPNRPVARELMEKSKGRIEIRWYNTLKEQYHTKLLMVTNPSQSVILGGSANFTARNLDDLNLENNLLVTAPSGSRVAQETNAYFLKLWSNDGAQYTLDYPAYEDKMVPVTRVLYRIQGLLGFTTF